MSGVRFCPFCKEPFDGETCPDHGLPLVSLVELASVRRVPTESETLASMDPRFGRGTIALGATLVFAGFFLPAVIDATRGDEATSAFELWVMRADYLAVVPAAMLALPTLAFARRTRRDLLRSRAALGFVALMAFVALAVAASRVVAYATHLARIGAESDLRPAVGALAMGIGFVVLGVGIRRLGHAPR